MTGEWRANPGGGDVVIECGGGRKMDAVLVSLPVLFAALVTGALFWAMYFDWRERAAAFPYGLVRKTPVMSGETRESIREQVVEASCGNATGFRRRDARGERASRESGGPDGFERPLDDEARGVSE